MSIFIILIEIFYAAKVYWFKEELKDIFGNTTNHLDKNFMTSNVNTSFGFKDWTVFHGALITDFDVKT